MSSLTRFSSLRVGGSALIARALSRGISLNRAGLVALLLAAVLPASGIVLAPERAEAQTTPPTVALTLSPTRIAEDGGVSTVTATLSAAHTQNVMLTVGITGSARTNVELSTNKTLTIAKGDTTSTGSVTITSDDNFDFALAGFESVTVSAVATGGPANPANQTLAIVDDDTDVVLVSKGAVTVSETAGDDNTVTYTLALDAKPRNPNDDNDPAPVTIELSSDDEDAATVDPKSLTFTQANFRTPRTVTVTGVEDTVLNPGGKRITSISHSLKDNAANTNYAGLVVPGVTVTVTDNVVATTPGVTIHGTEVTVPENAGTVAYGVVLDLRPTGDVRITLTNDAPAVARVFPTTLTFTRSNWNSRQSVMVTGINNAVDNPNDATATISHKASGGGYDDVKIADVAVTATDDEATPTVTLVLIPDSINEMDGVSTVTAEMNHGSSEEVRLMVGISGPDTPGAVLSQNKVLTIAPGATESTGDVTISAVDNPDDGPHKAVTVSAALSSGTATLPSTPLTLTILDDDDATSLGATLSRTAVTVDEDGGKGTYTVELDTKPTANVTITLTSNDQAVATVSPATMTFTPSNWNAAQSVTVTGVGNSVDNPIDAATTISHRAAGGGYDSVTIDNVVVTATDNEATPTVTLRLVPPRISEDGGSATVTASLSPHGSSEAVRLTVRTTGTGVTLSADKVLTIATGDTRSTGIVTITAVNDETPGTDDRMVPVSAAVSGMSRVANPADTTLTVVEDDFPDAGVTVSEHGVTVVETEGSGNTATYTLVLTANPSGSVRIVPASDDADIATVSPDMLTFTSANWETPQMVTVTGVEDEILNPSGGRTTFIRHALTVVSGANSYNGLRVADTAVTVTDNDGGPTPSVTLSTSAVTVPENAGTVAYGVVLDTQPTGDVRIALTNDAPAVARVRTHKDHIKSYK